ncbi:hypothetical protein [Klebsiella quasipneumoniae]|nr:hypothetical protein [Klebsiella quasipneumoniae]
MKIIDGDNIDGKMAIKNTLFVRYLTSAVRAIKKAKIKLML